MAETKLFPVCTPYLFLTYDQLCFIPLMFVVHPEVVPETLALSGTSPWIHTFIPRGCLAFCTQSTYLLAFEK